MTRGIITVLGAMLLLAAPLSAQQALHNRTDSIKNVLGLEVDGSKLIERSGGGEKQLQLYTTADRSVLTWSAGDIIYTYEIKGIDHERRAAALLEQIQKHGIATFVTRRDHDRKNGFTKYFGVLALKVRSSD